MGRWTLTGAALAAALLIPTAAAADLRSDVRKARAYAKARQGVVSLSLRTGGRAFGYRPLATAPSASVVKAILLVAYLREPGVGRRDLRPDERALLGPMIRRSRNRAATAVRNRIGNDALVALASQARMRRFVPADSWGSSTICAADQTRFFLRIRRLLPRRHRRYAMGLLETVVPRQRWGIGRAVPEGWRLYLKGGWGSRRGELEHQVARLERGHRRVTLAVLTMDNPSPAYGRETQRGVAHRLLRHLR